ncbi:response regulator [bacterium]|jgi:CheY-like chemotaxis protein|nr:response regulator [bacterium]
MSRLETLIISPDDKFYENFFQSVFEPNRFLVKHATTIEEAGALLRASNRTIGSIFLDISETSDKDPAEYMHELRTPFFPEISLCVKTTKDDDTTFARPIIDYIRSGAHGVIRLPTYDSEILWLAKKALTLYLTRKRVIDHLGHPDYSDRMAQFFNLLMSRKERGLPVSYKELELFFLPKNKLMDLDKIAEKVKRPPVDDYKNTTILIIEDEIKTSEWYKEYLERNCFNVLVANSGKHALEILTKSHPIHVVILDVELGDMTGNDLIPTIKKKYPKAEIIMVTAFTEFDLIIHTLKLGAFDYLVKSETDLSIINQKIIQALHKRYFEDFFQDYLE